MMALLPVQGSLRSKLLVPLVWLWLSSAAIATLAAFWAASRAAETSFDRMLKDDALALASQVRWDADGPSFKADLPTAASLVFDSVAPSLFTVRTQGGHTLVGNAELDVPPHAEAATDARPLFYDIRTARGGTLRAVALRVPGPSASDGVWVIVGESQAKRNQIGRELALAIFMPAAALVFVVVPLLYLGVRYGLAPAHATATAVASRDIDDLSPLPVDHVPDELRGLVVHINGLLTRLQEAVTRERNFIAEAAHQLRTPVAGIKLLAEDLQRTCQTHPDRPPDREVLDELHGAAARAAHLVQQLLTLARAGRLERPGADAERFDLAALVQQAVTRWNGPAAAAGKTLDVQVAPGPVWLTGNAFMLEEALSNLIDNALLHGGQAVQVQVERSEREALVHVLDDGPALESATRAHMLAPFWRGRESRPGGSGLGLPIAEKAVRRLGGALRIASRPQAPGTRITFHLPLQSAAH